MTFIVTFIALLIERFFDWSHLRHWRWYIAYQHAIANKFRGQSPYLILAFIIIPLLIVVLLIGLLLTGWLYGVAKLVFYLWVLLYCLGPQNLWANLFACVNALTSGDMSLAVNTLKTSFGIVETENAVPQTLHRRLVNGIFVEANRRVFAVIFWYVILGAVGAFLYRTITLSAGQGQEALAENSELSARARLIESILDWVPVRLFTFIFALSGHFVQVLSCWRKKVLLGLDSNERLLAECGAAALGYNEQEELPNDGSVEKNAVSLLDRSFVITLIIIVIVTLLI